MAESNRPPESPFGPSLPSRHPYPYVSVRYLSAVYGLETIAVMGTPGGDQARYLFPIGFAEVLTALKKPSRALLIEKVLEQVKTDGLRRCLVFGKEDSVYLEPDGTCRESKEPPSGGIDLSGLQKPKF